MQLKYPRLFVLAAFIALAGVSFLPLFGCTKSPSTSDSALTPEQSAARELSVRGRSVYQTHCISCHNPNPRKAGAVGPDLYGSSLVLLQARLIDGKYPDGYTPKRPGSAGMPLFPQLKSDLEALHAFLNAAD